jgi:hypothetical protein
MTLKKWIPTLISCAPFLAAPSLAIANGPGDPPGSNYDSSGLNIKFRSGLNPRHKATVSGTIGRYALPGVSPKSLIGDDVAPSARTDLSFRARAKFSLEDLVLHQGDLEITEFGAIDFGPSFRVRGDLGEKFENWERVKLVSPKIAVFRGAWATGGDSVLTPSWDDRGQVGSTFEVVLGNNGYKYRRLRVVDDQGSEISELNGYVVEPVSIAFSLPFRVQAGDAPGTATTQVDLQGEASLFGLALGQHHIGKRTGATAYQIADGHLLAKITLRNKDNGRPIAAYYRIEGDFYQLPSGETFGAVGAEVGLQTQIRKVALSAGFYRETDFQTSQGQTKELKTRGVRFGVSF